MKRTVCPVLVVLLFCAAAASIFAQTAVPRIPEFSTMSSIQSGATAGMFTNVFDAAITIDEASTDIPFSKIGRSYFFGGIAANPSLSNVTASGIIPIFGYYHAGNRPWSIFGRMEYTGTGPQTADIKDGNTTRKPYYRGFKDLNTDLQFLMNFGSVSAGIRTMLYFTDNKVISNSSNVEVDNGTNVIKYINKDFATSVGVLIPVYFTTGIYKHYLEAGFVLASADKSVKNIVDGETTVDNPAIATVTVPMLHYKTARPLGPNNNQLTLHTTFGFPILATKPKVDSHAGFILDVGSYYDMNFSPAGDWLRFRMRPEIEYAFAMLPNVSTVNGMTHTAALSLSAGMEIKPEKWPLGLMLGSKGGVTFTHTGTTTEAGSTRTQIINNNWTTAVYMAGGIFIPLPNDFRLDIAVYSATNVFEFGKLTIQLIVPLK